MDHEAGDVEGLEQQIGTERGLEVRDADVLPRLVVARRVPATLVELAVRRQVRLRSDAEQLAPVDHDGAVVEAVAVAQRRAHHEHREEVLGCLDQPEHRLLHGVEHGILEHEVVDGVAGQAQLGEDGDGHGVVVALACRGQHGVGIGGGIGDRDRDRAGGDPRESVAVRALEVRLVVMPPVWHRPSSNARRGVGSGG